MTRIRLSRIRLREPAKLIGTPYLTSLKQREKAWRSGVGGRGVWQDNGSKRDARFLPRGYHPRLQTSHGADVGRSAARSFLAHQRARPDAPRPHLAVPGAAA